MKPWMLAIERQCGETNMQREARVFAPLVEAMNAMAREMGGRARFASFNGHAPFAQPTPKERRP